MTVPEIPYCPLTLTKHWSAPSGGSKVTQEKNLDEEVRLHNKHTPKLNPVEMIPFFCPNMIEMTFKVNKLFSASNEPPLSH